ncbi:hypothetical protein FRC07_002662 [Ceratobasidium sp. 392]|nr:hypothetical protein FRC07_002662 [Ceratobasidium sp. 392]
MQPQSTRPDELRLPELQHPRPIRAAFLYHHMVLEEMVHRNAEVDNSTQSFVPTLPATHSASSQDMSSDPWRIREGSLYLLPLSQHVPWDARSGQYSPSRDFAISNPSFGPSTPTRSWGRQFSGSTPSFGPATPADSVSAGWDYDHYVAGLDWAPPWNEESGSEDIHARPQVEVRKAKKATMGRKLVRKLKGMLAAVRNMSA